MTVVGRQRGGPRQERRLPWAGRSGASGAHFLSMHLSKHAAASLRGAGGEASQVSPPSRLGVEERKPSGGREAVCAMGLDALREQLYSVLHLLRTKQQGKKLASVRPCSREDFSEAESAFRPELYAASRHQSQAPALPRSSPLACCAISKDFAFCSGVTFAPNALAAIVSGDLRD